MYNKKAKYNYELLDSYTCGIILTSLEVKAIRENKMAFNDAYCIIENNEVFLKKFHISIDASEQDCLRDRKLLLNKKEILKIKKVMKEKGFTIVPTSIYFNETQLIKLAISTARGKNTYDKRSSLKEKDLKRQNNE